MAENRRLQGRAPHAGGCHAPTDACPRGATPWRRAMALTARPLAERAVRPCKKARSALQNGPYRNMPRRRPGRHRPEAGHGLLRMQPHVGCQRTATLAQAVPAAAEARTT